MIFGLNSRLSELFRLTDQRDLMQTRVESLRDTDIALQTQIAFATSDVAVEGWARDQGHMALPNDHVIVPLPPYGSTPQVAYLPSPTPGNSEKWQIWWNLFFAK